MTIERAIEILDPEHREHYESIEPVNEACRMGMDALKQVAELEFKNKHLKEQLKNSIPLPYIFSVESHANPFLVDSYISIEKLPNGEYSLQSHSTEENARKYLKMRKAKNGN